MIQYADRIFIAHNHSTIGAAIVRQLRAQGYGPSQLVTAADLDLTQQAQVQAFFAQTRPDVVYLPGLALERGSKTPEAIVRDMACTTNTLQAAYEAGVARLLFITPATIYPQHALQPIAEEELFNGAPCPQWQAQAVVQWAGLQLCEIYSHPLRERPADFRCAVVCQDYGPLDTQIRDTSLVADLIQRIQQARLNAQLFVTIPGHGHEQIELLHVDDLADACLHLMQQPGSVLSTHIPRGARHINIGSGEEINLSDLTHLICRQLGYRGTVNFDPLLHDLMPRCLLDSTRAHTLGWSPQHELEEGLHSVCSHHVDNNHKPLAKARQAHRASTSPPGMH